MNRATKAPLTPSPRAAAAGGVEPTNQLSGFPEEWLASTFSVATVGNGIMAVLAGVVAQVAADKLGDIGPFQVRPTSAHLLTNLCKCAQTSTDQEDSRPVLSFRWGLFYSILVNFVLFFPVGKRSTRSFAHTCCCCCCADGGKLSEHEQNTSRTEHRNQRTQHDEHDRACLSVCLSVCLSCLSVRPSVCLSVRLSVCVGKPCRRWPSP